MAQRNRLLSLTSVLQFNSGTSQIKKPPEGGAQPRNTKKVFLMRHSRPRLPISRGANYIANQRERASAPLARS
jgi:hypothetical protein